MLREPLVIHITTTDYSIESIGNEKYDYPFPAPCEYPGQNCP